MPTANAPKKQAPPGAWKPGQSGNPKGKPTGSRNKATLLAATLIDGEAEKITRLAVDMALCGDPTAMRLCMERLLPPRKGCPVRFSMGRLETTQDVTNAYSRVWEAVGRGKLTPEEATALLPILEHKLKAIEVADLEIRLNALESAVGR